MNFLEFCLSLCNIGMTIILKNICEGQTHCIIVIKHLFPSCSSPPHPRAGASMLSLVRCLVQVSLGHYLPRQVALPTACIYNKYNNICSFETYFDATSCTHNDNLMIRTLTSAKLCSYTLPLLKGDNVNEFEYM